MLFLVTGVAGFIGFHVANALLDRGEAVVGVDNLNPYYDVRLKEARLEQLRALPGFVFRRLDIADQTAIAELFASRQDIERVVHLAAQAGVRYSLVDPYSYVSANLMGQVVLLEAAQRLPRLSHFVFASSSSVYGGNTEQPFSETQRVDRPLSLYGATKRSGELVAHAYAHLFALPLTGLRLFTVYGPWGRPDMACFAFARAIMRGEPITLYGEGAVRRDFTYIDDVVGGVLAVLDRPPADNPPLRLLNLGNHQSESVATLVDLLEKGLKRRAIRCFAPLPPTDPAETLSDISAIATLLGFAPRTGLAEGIARFCTWFADWYAANDAAA